MLIKLFRGGRKYAASPECGDIDKLSAPRQSPARRFDLGSRVNGYHTDPFRTFSMSYEQRDSGISQQRPGNMTKDHISGA
jgi:hypothetical protein